jgi:hypothetical protein
MGMKFFILTSMFFLIACSNNAGKTRTEIKVFSGFSIDLTLATNGAMIYGRSGNGNAFGKKVIGNELILDIPNGMWNFYIVMWDSSAGATPLTGKVRCGKSLGINLTGGSIDVNLNANNANCNDGIYSPNIITASNSDFVFPALKMFSCSSNDAVTTPSDTNCSEKNKGAISSYRIILPSFRQPGGAQVNFEGDSIEGECLIVNPSSLTEGFAPIASGATNIPLGSPNFPIHTIVRGYFDTACNNSGRGFIDEVFINGTFQPTPSAKSMSSSSEAAITKYTGANIAASTAGAGQHLYLSLPHNIICSGPRLVSSFASGNGIGIPYGICTKIQLNSIGGANWTTNLNHNNNFALLADLNYFNNFTATTYSPTTDPFTILGKPLTVSETNPFAGKFYGNSHKIAGISIVDSSPSGLHVGFFRKMSGGSEIRDLTFVMPEIVTPGFSMVGVVVGEVSTGATATLIKNIKIILPRIKAENDVGGIAGHTDGTGVATVNMHNLEVLDLDISAYRNMAANLNVGGIVGNMTTPKTNTIFQSKATGVIYAEHTTLSSALYAGGLVGYVDGDCGGLDNISQSMAAVDISAGHTTPNGTTLVSIGGIAGKVNSTTGVFKIVDSYAVGNVHARNSQGATLVFVGGLIGSDAGVGVEISRAFHTKGSLSATSNPGLAVIKGILGTSPSTPTCTGVLNTTQVGTVQGAPDCGKNAVVPLASISNSAYLNTNFGALGTIFNTTGTLTWYLQDAGFDYPRLSWEEKRDCSGKFAGTFAGGVGSEQDPYLICNSTQFLNLALDANNGLGVYYKLLDNIDFKGINNTTTLTVPLAIAQGFKGTLDGNGFTISNYFKNASGNALAGFFQNIEADALIKDLHFKGMELTGLGNGSGSLASMNYGEINNVHIQGNVSSNVSSIITGGMVGTNQSGGLILYSSTDVEMKGLSKVGGIAGINNGGGILFTHTSGSISPIINAALTFWGGIAGQNLTGTSTNHDIAPRGTIAVNGLIQESNWSAITNGRNRRAKFIGHSRCFLLRTNQ